MAGCIIGRALYEGTLTLPEALVAAGANHGRCAAKQLVGQSIRNDSTFSQRKLFMAKYSVEQIRNIVFCGHGSAGKTTLVDKILTTTGAVNRTGQRRRRHQHLRLRRGGEAPQVHDRSRRVVHFDHAGKHFNVIDTPGYPDFIGQAIGAMRGVDTAAIVINAQSGIEVNTRRVFAEAKKAGLGRIIVINKMDADNIDFATLVESIQELFGKACVLLNVPLGQGADFRGVASTLKPPADAAGALVDPAEISESLLEIDHRGRRGGDGALFRGHAAHRRRDRRG